MVSNSTVLSVISFFVVIGPLIFFHELGHFLAARWNNIAVEEFGIGYPPRMLILLEHKGTKYTLNWLPLGGFMRPAGEDDPKIPGGFSSAPKLARFIVLAAGPGANILVAFLLLIALYMIGVPVPSGDPGARVAVVEEASPASQAGLREGDIILYADGQYVEEYGDLTQYILTRTEQHPGEPISLTVQRGSQTLELQVTPRHDPPEGQGPTGIQVQPITVIQQYNVFEAVGQSAAEMGFYARAFVELPLAAIRQQIPVEYLRPVSIVGISQLGGQAMGASFDEGTPWPILRLTAAISMALAITNLLPLPALDGGRILFVIIEAFRGRRVDPQRETMVHLIGFAILLTTMLVFVYLDIVNPLVP